MPKIHCASCECKWNNDRNMCTYKGTILMNDCFVMTVHEGRQHYHRCRMFEESEDVKHLREQIMKFISGK